MTMRPHDVPADPSKEDFQYVLQHKTLHPKIRRRVALYDLSTVAHALTVAGKRRATIYVKTKPQRDLLCKLAKGWVDVTEAFVNEYVTEIPVEDAVVAPPVDEKTKVKNAKKKVEAIDSAIEDLLGPLEGE